MTPAGQIISNRSEEAFGIYWLVPLINNPYLNIWERMIINLAFGVVGLIRSSMIPILLIFSLICAMGQWCPVFASSSTVQRTIIAEPYYQIYEDQFTLSSSPMNFTVSFILPNPEALHSIKAYGPDNSALNLYAAWDGSTGNMTILVETNGTSSFTLETILHYTTQKSSQNYTTFLNLYPAVEEEMGANLILFTPSNSTLFEYPENLTYTTVDGKPALVGEDILEPSRAYNATIGYSGDFELIEINNLEHRIAVGSGGITVTDSVQVVNINSNIAYNVTIRLPDSASLVRVYDSIGYMNYELNGAYLTIDLRTRILPTERASFTLVYDIPAASAFESQAGNIVLSGSFLPGWCQYLVRNLTLVVELPLGSSNVVAQGLQVINGSSWIACWNQASDVTPHSGLEYVVSFVPAPYSIPAGSVVLLVFLVAITVAIIAYYFLKIRKNELKKRFEAEPSLPKSPKRKK